MTREERNLYMREYYHKNKDKAKARVRTYKRAKPEKVAQWNKEHDERNPELVKARQARNHKRHYSERKDRIRANALTRLYGITLEQYEQMVTTQNGLCAICQQPSTSRLVRNGIAPRLCVDHNHMTNQVRQLLCAECNLVVGQIEKHIAHVPTILKYLESYK